MDRETSSASSSGGSAGIDIGDRVEVVAAEICGRDLLEELRDYDGLRGPVLASDKKMGDRVFLVNIESEKRGGEVAFPERALKKIS